MESNRTSQEERAGFQLIATRDEFNDMDDDFGAGYKNCTKCSILKPLDEFWVETKGVMGRKSWCKTCSGTRTIKSPPKKGTIRNDRIQQALEAAAYRYLKEIM